MSGIYIKRRAFWKEEQNEDKVTKYGILCLFILIIFFYFNYHPQKDSNIKLSDIKSTVKKHFTKKEKENDIKITTNLNHILQSSLDEEYYYYYKFNNLIKELLFLKCTNDEISKNIEHYYNYFFNKKKSYFEIVSEYNNFKENASLTILDDRICLNSGSGQIALKTQKIPECIEIKNLNIANLYYNKANPTLNIILHMVRYTQDVKIHLFPAFQKILYRKHIDRYYNGDQMYTKNLVLYTKENDNFIRICNFKDDFIKYYENTIWIEFIWDAGIQNNLCFEDFWYFHN